MTTFETSTRVVAVFRGSSATMAEFDAYFVSHEVAFVIFCDAFFGSLTSVKFLKGASNNQTPASEGMHTTKP